MLQLQYHFTVIQLQYHFILILIQGQCATTPIPLHCDTTPVPLHPHISVVPLHSATTPTLCSGTAPEVSQLVFYNSNETKLNQTERTLSPSLHHTANTQHLQKDSEQATKIILKQSTTKSKQLLPNPGRHTHTPIQREDIYCTFNTMSQPTFPLRCGSDHVFNDHQCH